MLLHMVINISLVELTFILSGSGLQFVSLLEFVGQQSYAVPSATPSSDQKN